MSDARAKKTRIRAGHKGVATRRVKEVDELLAAITPGRPADATKLAQLRLSLREKLETISKLDDELFELIDDEGELTSEIDQADIFKQSIYATLVKLDDQLNPKGPPATASAPATSAPTPASHARLPKLNIRPFNGDIRKWTTFWDSFESSIHSNTTLSDVEKFTYLQSLLEHSAREAISGLTLSSANYSEAISVLKGRYGNKQKIIALHMDTLLNLEPVTSQHNLTSIRRLYDQIEANLRSLGVTSDTYTSLLLPVVIKKIPSEI